MSLHQVRAATRELLSVSIENLQYPQISLEEMYLAREEVGDVIAESLYDYQEQVDDRDTAARLKTVADEVSRTVEMIEGTSVLTGGDVEILNASLEGMTRLLGLESIKLELGENGQLTQVSTEGIGDFIAKITAALSTLVKRARGRLQINRNRSEGYLSGIRKQLAFCHNGIKEVGDYAGGDKIQVPVGWAEAFTLSGSPSKDYSRDAKVWLDFTHVLYDKSVPHRLGTAETALAGIKGLDIKGLAASLAQVYGKLKVDTSIIDFIGPSGRTMVFNRSLEVNKKVEDSADVPEYAKDLERILTPSQWLFVPNKSKPTTERTLPNAATARQWLATLELLIKATEDQLYHGNGKGRQQWDKVDKLLEQLDPAVSALESKLDRGVITREQGRAINGLSHAVAGVLDVMTDDMLMVNKFSMRLASALAWHLEEWVQKARKHA